MASVEQEKLDRYIMEKIESVESTENIPYKKFYIKNDIFWGIGIENETYFKSDLYTKRSGDYIERNHKRERYSIDYNTNYKTAELQSYLSENYEKKLTYDIPTYINSNTFKNTDTKGEHKTMYTKENGPNKKFSGKSINDMLFEFNELFSADYEKNYIYDGDTIEFVTQNFYKKTVKECVDELVSYKKKYLNLLNEFMIANNMPTLHFPRVNYGMIHFQTNPRNIGIFNNGTYHFNLTMPTKLNEKKDIADPASFLSKHQRAMKLIQWFEPLIAGLYGSPDVFAYNSNKKYVAGSLRLAASRYISIGTYDTDSMESGKILNVEKDTIKLFSDRNFWYNRLYDNTNYIPCDRIGFDFNYAKHFNSGIEMRIFDYFPEEFIEPIMNFIVLILDQSMKTDNINNASDSPSWNNLVYNVLQRGYYAKIEKDFQIEMEKLVGYKASDRMLITKYMKGLVKHIYEKNHQGECSKVFSPNMSEPILSNINRYMFESNFLQYLPNQSNAKIWRKLYGTYTIYCDDDLFSTLMTFIDLDHETKHMFDFIETLQLEENLSFNAFYKQISKIKEDVMMNRSQLFTHNI